MRTRLILLMLTILPLSALAEEDSALEAGTWALQFQVTENFTLDDFQGSIVSIKYHSSANSAWRAGINLGFSSASEDRQILDTGVPQPDMTTEFSSSGAALGLQYVYYANPEDRVVMLLGGGPFVGFENRERDVDAGGAGTSRQEVDIWHTGVSGVIGVEWLVASHVGIHAEYGFEYEYTSTSTTYALDDDEDTRDSHAHSFGAREVLLGVSAYF